MKNGTMQINGTKLYEIRSQMRISLRQASELIGISKSTLCRYERSEKLDLAPERVEDICRIYRVRPADLAGGANRTDAPRTLSRDEVAEVYSRIDERTRIRVSRILLRALD